MGPWKGLKAVRRVVEDCIKNVHPIYHIKASTIFFLSFLAGALIFCRQNHMRYILESTQEIIHLAQLADSDNFKLAHLLLIAFD